MSDLMSDLTGEIDRLRLALASEKERADRAEKQVEVERRQIAIRDEQTAEVFADLRPCVARFVAAEKRAAVLEAVFMQDQPWSLRDAVARLVNVAEHSLGHNSCDRHGHEGDRDAMIVGREALVRIEAALSGSSSFLDAREAAAQEAGRREAIEEAARTVRSVSCEIPCSRPCPACRFARNASADLRALLTPLAPVPARAGRTEDAD